jgi:glycosyltransferase involved in cell wall biosynthesis
MSRPISISFVLPVSNADCHLRQALVSVRWQTVANWECVCVNDGGSDEIRQTLDDFAAADSRFRVIHQTSQGAAATLNRAIEEARHEWVAIMQGDHISAPKRLEVQRTFITKHPDTVVVGSDALCVNIDGLGLGVRRNPSGHRSIERRLRSGECPIIHSSALVRREAVLEAGGYHEDCELAPAANLWLRMARLGRLANIPRVLLHYRRADADYSFEEVKPGEWALLASRSGCHETARGYRRRQEFAEPRTLYTFRVSAECAIRRILSKYGHHRTPTFSLPETHPWDCVREPQLELRRAA